MTVYTNAGDMFAAERLAEISTFPEWTSSDLETTRLQLEELLEKREQQLEEEEGLDRLNTAYYWTSYVLRRLGYCYSVSELPPQEGDDRPDVTLFYDANDFMRAVDYRTTREFFSHAVGVMRLIGWNDSLDEIEIDGQTYHPGYNLDHYLRGTGVDFGILTNGRIWRLYHRDSSGLLDTYYEINLVDALRSNDLEDFKYFWMIFSPKGIGGETAANAIVNRLMS